IVSQGTPDKVMADPKSLTGAYLTGKKLIQVPAQRRQGNGKFLKVKGAKANNLKNLTVEFPLGTLTCVTGVSGGGKSSLVIETLYKAIARQLHGARDLPGEYTAIEGLEAIDKIIDIDQSPIGRTPRSNPATYIGAFTSIRDWF